ncbi:hypothetical protein [Chondromyces crocatus]|uniref:Uncharacterized protein n=1 Tax=Chondromyces crocatus TaxID=52 RepID=A0A0K1E954_CHOCO|nr:hypothetical protein [Chondromyces crocatus]AKT37384.1 uncharacterized protein CMC5_015190 [Chondromyces crocatus]
MNQLKTIGLDEELDEIDGQLAQTEISTAADPLTLHLTAAFTQLRQDLLQVRAQEVSRHDAVKAADARAYPVDDELNAISDEVKVAVLALAENNYQHPLYRQFYSGQSPSALKRPVLGEQLETMRTWVALLADQGSAVLAEIGVRLAPIIQRADEVVDAQTVAQQRLDVFERGARKAFVDRVNGQRKLAFGRIGEIIHATPGRKLTSSYAERFFQHGPSARTPTIAGMERLVARQKAKLDRLEARLAEMKSKQDQQRQAQQEAQLEERRLKVVEAEKRAAAAMAELEALKEQIAKEQGASAMS